MILNIKNRLIDRIMSSNDDAFLEEIEKKFISAKKDSDLISLNSYQIEMLLMSENDIDSGKLISEKELKRIDAEWLN